MKIMPKSAIGMMVSAALVLPHAAAIAGTPPSLRDVVGAQGASGESQLENRGFVYVDGSNDSERKYSYYWNRSTKECAKVTTFDGSYESIETATLPDCNQTQEHRKSDRAVGAAVGAAALLGIAALASKSHQRGEKYSDQNNTAEYERGYRDGLYNQSFHNYNSATAYSDGYTNGVQQRGH